MPIDWFDAQPAIQVGLRLADDFATGGEDIDKALYTLLSGADREIRPLRLNAYKRAKLANSMKWRLIEKGVDRKSADQTVQSLLLHLSRNLDDISSEDDITQATAQPIRASARDLLTEGNHYFDKGAYLDAMESYRAVLRLQPKHAEALNNLGSALCKIGRIDEAEEHFRRSVRLRPDYAEAHTNLGNLLQWRGRTSEAEIWSRRAVKLNPKLAAARNNLGLIQLFLGRLGEAETQFRKVLKTAPRNAEALFGLGRITAMEGRFEEAEVLFKRAIEGNAMLAGAWAAIPGLRRMTSSDTSWLTGASEVASLELPPPEKSELYFAIAKFYDDTGDFKHAFHFFREANELLKTTAEPYNRRARSDFVDDMIRAYPAKGGPLTQGFQSESQKPVFVVGMPRSGTTLVEQIIASHPSALGAGELTYWGNAVLEHESAVRKGALDEIARKRIATSYSRILDDASSTSQKIVDKAPTNSDFLGLIYSIFPRARFIYVNRDPVDTCLSCYFQRFSVALKYSMDLSDLAHYYTEHRRLVTHWRSVLPPESLVEISYEDLVADQEAATRKILDAIGLPWDQRCMNFHATKRAVVTSSYWQVRQQIYGGSVARWRNYKKYIGPLLELRG